MAAFFGDDKDENEDGGKGNWVRPHPGTNGHNNEELHPPLRITAVLSITPTVVLLAMTALFGDDKDENACARQLPRRTPLLHPSGFHASPAREHSLAGPAPVLHHAWAAGRVARYRARRALHDTDAFLVMTAEQQAAADDASNLEFCEMPVRGSRVPEHLLSDHPASVRRRAREDALDEPGVDRHRALAVDRAACYRARRTFHRTDAFHAMTPEQQAAADKASDNEVMLRRWVLVRTVAQLQQHQEHLQQQLGEQQLGEQLLTRMFPELEAETTDNGSGDDDHVHADDDEEDGGRGRRPASQVEDDAKDEDET
ncbi:MAG: hypothetical protein M1826_002397 [Phylliscum demangeonii]|nr:MAG: hypothetical protein M1826_002397 [Phylliscum demangeonii]